MFHVQNKSMKKNNTPFIDEDLKLLRANFSRLGRKHGVSGQYVGQIAGGKRAANTQTAKNILKDLRILLTFLKPKK